jgi:hypothetical protein
MARACWLLIVAGLFIGMVISSRYVLHAQGTGELPAQDANRIPAPASGPELEPAGDGAAAVGDNRSPQATSSATATRNASGALTVQDALLRPFPFSFSRPTALTQVCAALRRALKSPVVLDLAALKRLNVAPEDTVQLELEGVRLKTGLKLLLDQLGLTYRVIAEDNLLIITDHEGAEDPAERILDELRALHRDLHDVQDAVDELRDYVVEEPGEGARVRKPTIIEEMPENPGQQSPFELKKSPAEGPEKAEKARPGSTARPAPSRIPLAHPRRRG